MNRRRFAGLLVLAAAGLLVAGRTVVDRVVAQSRRIRIRRKPWRRADLYRSHDLVG